MNKENKVDLILKLSIDGMNNAEIAKIVKCSRENVRQILKRFNIYSPRCYGKNREE